MYMERVTSNDSNSFAQNVYLGVFDDHEGSQHIEEFDSIAKEWLTQSDTADEREEEIKDIVPSLT